ncbi:N-acetyltransferase B complex non catalytic subunit-domain-containing protein [Radiomyces spectabilis]|uniref:N-acetyltransferase B complex non catalytic subunit-domain-containing protein n=1 Tax=Radiomyces spectabilis TaxID=64574 RepID=UPI002220A088|nr:N-acetyltransferase B complex non catalytic subunit-domain-containing protein [Radiomyces spectabilis]KAI8384685.1 N-acetyltransferase B complex non catalytic subunit-domain-containing protein [Radiomyces spectabilis]
MVLDYITEKKLRPLYEAIDEGQYKLALQNVNKMLKKSPDWPLLKALKAVVLVRTGKQEEAVDLCTQVKKAMPIDDATLQAASMAYKELGQHQAVVTLYENAANQQPRNEEFANHWFMAMVRNNDYKGQQQAALKLHRTFKQNKYLFWAIMSLALQGQGGNSLSYTLAERMMAKAQEDGRLEEVEHLRLFLLIYLDQQRYDQALALLDTPLGQKSLRDPEVRQIRSELLLKTKKWEDVLETSQRALSEENSDDWISWLAYFDAVNGLLDQESSEEILEKAVEMIGRLKETALKAAVLKRGPFLAELEWDHRLNKRQNRDQTLTLDHIVAYFDRFGSKSCCFEDLQTYIAFLRATPEAAKKFIQTLQNSIKPATEKSAQVKNVYKNITIRKLEHFLDLHAGLSLPESLQLVNALWQAYEDALPLGQGLEKTESQYGDEFVLLASHILYDMYQQHKHTALVIQAITLLETALRRSTYNFQLKLTLVRLYTVLGVYTRPLQIFATMDIKQIQFDTMIHYFTDRFIALGAMDPLEEMLYESMMIYKSNEVETPEMLVKAYQYGTFSKIQEFIEFRTRLDKSLQHAITRTELARIEALNSSFQVKYGVQYFQELDINEIKFDDDFIQTRSDNRDFKVMMNCNSDEKPALQEMMKPACSSNKIWLQTFSYILNIIKAACDTKQAADLASLIQDFTAFLKRDDLQNNITNEEIWLAQLICSMGSALLLLQDQVKQGNNSEEAVSFLKQASAHLQKQSSTSTLFSGSHIEWQQFHVLSTLLEGFNYGSILLEMINRGLGLTSKEAKRKATENADNNALLACIVELHSDLKTFLHGVQSQAKSGKEMLKPQLQKKLYKSILDSEFALECFTKKEHQNALNDHTKIVVNSWGTSVSRLSDEIDRRVQKFQ